MVSALSAKDRCECARFEHDEGLQPLEMCLIEPLRAADRYANAMERNRVILADLVKRSMGRTAGTHVVFGVDFKEPISLPVGQDRLQMLVLEARANTAGNGMSRKAECRRRVRG
jgi:hypothetical protein